MMKIKKFLFIRHSTRINIGNPLIFSAYPQYSKFVVQSKIFQHGVHYIPFGEVTIATDYSTCLFLFPSIEDYNRSNLLHRSF